MGRHRRELPQNELALFLYRVIVGVVPEAPVQTDKDWQTHLVHYLFETDPVPLVLDLRITHDRWGSSSDPRINGHLHYPNDIDRSLNETVTDKIRKYLDDYNNNPPSSVTFIPTIPSTSGRLHSEFV